MVSVLVTVVVLGMLMCNMGRRVVRFLCKNVKKLNKITQKRLKNGVVLKKTITLDDLAALACEESAERAKRASKKGRWFFDRLCQNRPKNC